MPGVPWVQAEAEEPDKAAPASSTAEKVEPRPATRAIWTGWKARDTADLIYGRYKTFLDTISGDIGCT